MIGLPAGSTISILAERHGCDRQFASRFVFASTLFSAAILPLLYGKEPTVSGRLYEYDTKDRYFHIYYNPSRQAAEREQLEQRIEKFRQFLDKDTKSSHKLLALTIDEC